MFNTKRDCKERLAILPFFIFFGIKPIGKIYSQSLGPIYFFSLFAEYKRTKKKFIPNSFPFFRLHFPFDIVQLYKQKSEREDKEKRMEKEKSKFLLISIPIYIFGKSVY